MSRNCRSAVTKVFPDICPDYLQSVAKPLGFDPEKVINWILDRQESGQPYGRKLKPKEALRKRKREADKQDGKSKRKNIKPYDSKAPKSGDPSISCECCFNKIPIDQAVHCAGQPAHSFCKDCPRRNVESQVALGKPHIVCMSIKGCTASFAQGERDKFMDKGLSLAWDRCEQEANVRLANIPDLARCPFCSYAEEYPSVSVNKEFKCRHLQCGITSCRRCNLETHIPMTCTEAAVARSADSRHKVEEAMSNAVIRKCNKCATPFVKEAGCNKMTCTRTGCQNVQCYVCSQSCNYSHFNDASRGGKVGNCPLFDDVEDRHAREVREAENAARTPLSEATNAKLAASVPGFDFSL